MFVQDAGKEGSGRLISYIQVDSFLPGTDRMLLRMDAWPGMQGIGGAFAQEGVM
jgi:hypothetical protein